MVAQKSTLVVATRNLGKLREIADALGDLPLVFRSLQDFPDIPPIEEGGSTFCQNARIKARTVHAAIGGFVLADDSGLECDDLAGAPGIRSARYAGEGASDEDNNRKLIADLAEVHDPSRCARYVCALVLIDPEGNEIAVEECCEGAITLTPSGNGGFGYDPYFYLPEKKCTMAELPLAEKNTLSHRGKALAELKAALQEKFRKH